MSESVKNLINAISVGSAINTEEAFNSAMAEKISVKLDAMRQDVAANMFATEEVISEEETGMTNKHAKQAAKEISKAHKHLTVTSMEGGHHVHHKDDEDGNDPDIRVHAEKGKIHLTQDHGGGTGHEHSTHSDVASAVAHAHKHLVGNIPKEV